jgi:hypothetical protein
MIAVILTIDWSDSIFAAPNKIRDKNGIISNNSNNFFRLHLLVRGLICTGYQKDDNRTVYAETKVYHDQPYLYYYCPKFCCFNIVLIEKKVLLI